MQLHTPDWSLTPEKENGYEKRCMGEPMKNDRGRETGRFLFPAGPEPTDHGTAVTAACMICFEPVGLSNNILRSKPLG